MNLDADIAEYLADTALGHVTREFPHKLDHILASEYDISAPRQLHPIFHGSFDWHSCVHSYWLLLRLRRRFPELSLCARIEERVDASWTEANVARELAYLHRPSATGFERPYGWAWLLALHREAELHTDRNWSVLLEPLAAAVVKRFSLYFPKLSYPIRAGTHANTAFAMLHALAWVDGRDVNLAQMIRRRASVYFGRDRGCQAWEPCGDDFLSSALIEALCMKQVLSPERFAQWLADFLPDLREGRPTSLFVPAVVSDRFDDKIVHLDGLNLSRAWCWRELAPALEPDLAEAARAAATTHLQVSIPFIGEAYTGEHWLATFALLALDGLA